MDDKVNCFDAVFGVKESEVKQKGTLPGRQLFHPFLMQVSWKPKSVWYFMKNILYISQDPWKFNMYLNLCKIKMNTYEFKMNTNDL